MTRKVLKNVVFYVSLTLACTLAGAAIGAACGFGLGWLLSLGYESRGPGDPGHAPAYVALGLAFTGAGLGVVAGLAGGLVLCVVKRAKDANTRSSFP